MTNLKIKTKLMLIVISSILASIVFFTYTAISSYEKDLEKYLSQLKKDAYIAKKEELVNYSEMANKVILSYYKRASKQKIKEEVESRLINETQQVFNIIEDLYSKEKDNLSQQELKKRIIQIVSHSNYGHNGYFWINNLDAIMINHPIKKNLNGKNLYNFQDKSGKYIFKEFSSIAKEKGEGFVNYMWPKPNSTVPQQKVSYIKLFKPYGWVIGTGAYVSDTTETLQKEALHAIKNMRYGENGYFWINDMDNKMLMHPIKPSYDNKIFTNTPKVPSVQLGTEKLKKLNSDKAFIEYSFYTPATKKYSHKLSIVQKFKPWGWVIGTGAYTDYLDARIASERKIAQEEMNRRIINILITSAILLIILIILMIKFMERIIIDPLNDFQYGLNQFFKFLDDETVNVTKLKNNNKDEIGLMSLKTNIAITSAVKTYQELIDLRKQLEQKVESTTQNLDKTKKEYDQVNQIRKESLEYGSLIQASIVPSSKEINKVFTNHFVLDIQKDIINSQFYLLEKIRENEYIYVIMDCKKSGIKAVFTTMLINAIIKQAITQLKYDNQEDINSAWLLNYLNTNIENSQPGFDGAIVYYNKNKNIIKYSSANLPLHYFQDKSFHIIKPDMQTIGVDKEYQYTEHTIEIKDYLEFYISTHHYIEKCIDIYDFESPFQTTSNQFKDHLTDIDEDIVVSGFQIDNKPKTIIEYEGEFTQESANKYMEIIEDKIENMGLMSNISTNFVEQYQNILNYGKAKEIENTDVSPFGYIQLQQNSDATYSITTLNIVTLSDKQKIEPKLFEIQSLDRDGIRKRYRELRKSGKNTHAKGGGIGFYEIAKRCIKVEYSFTQINEDRFEFKFISFVSSGKK